MVRSVLYAVRMHAAAEPPDDYLLALGRLTYQWRLTEWAAVHLAGALSDDAHATVVRLRGQTAGQTAETLTANARKRAPEDADLAAVAERFAAAVKVRNDVMHAEPASDALTRPGTFAARWDDAECLRAITADFAQLWADLNGLFHGRYAHG